MKKFICILVLTAGSHAFGMARMPARLLVCRNLNSMKAPLPEESLEKLRNEMQELKKDLHEKTRILERLEAQLSKANANQQSNEGGKRDSLKNSREGSSNLPMNRPEEQSRQEINRRWDSSMDRLMPEEESNPWKKEQDRTKFW